MNNFIKKLMVLVFSVFLFMSASGIEPVAAETTGSDAGDHVHCTITTDQTNVSNGQYVSFSVNYQIDHGTVHAGDYIVVTIPDNLQNVDLQLDPMHFSGFEKQPDGTYHLIFNENAVNGLAGSFVINATASNTSEQSTTATIDVNGQTSTVTIAGQTPSGGSGQGSTKPVEKTAYDGSTIGFGGYDNSTGSGYDATEIGIYTPSTDVTANFRIMVNNAGHRNMTNVTVTDDIPVLDGVTFNNDIEVTCYVSNQSIDFTGRYVNRSSGNHIEIYFDHVNADDIPYITYSLTIKAGTTVKINNNAVINYTENGNTNTVIDRYRLQPGNGYSASVATKSVDKTVVSEDPGDQIVRYTITFDADKTFAAGALVMKDVLNPYVKYVRSYGDSAFDVTFDESTNTVTMTNNAEVDSSRKRTVTIITDFSNVPAGTDVTNTVGNTVHTIKYKGSLELSGMKTVSGKAPGTNVFHFLLKDAADNTLQDVTNDSTGSFTFSPIYYKASDLNVEHTYTVEEQTGTDFVYDTSIYTIKVTPTDSERDGVMEVNPVITKDGTEVSGITFDNQEKTEITVEKKWKGDPLDSVTVNLLANGTQISSAVLNTDNNWKYTFTDLVKTDSDGNEITYTVDEVTVDGYTKEITGNEANGFVITNTRSEKTSIPVKKNWIGPGADSVTVHLLANGTEVSSAVLNEENSWSYEFADLEKYDEEGKLITYTLTEDPLDNYSTVIDGDQNTGFTVTNTNTELTSVHVEKQWKGDPADSVTVNLLADGTQINNAVLNADNNWKQTFADLRKYDSTDGHEIKYTIEEVSVDGYTSVITGSAADGFIITNTRSEKTSIPVKKNWIGPGADSVTVHLFANGTEVSSAILNEENSWSYEFADLEKYDDEGQLINYTLTEDPLDNYSSIIAGDASTGFTVTNTNTTKIDIPVEKQWKGEAADSVTIKLLADGEEKDSTVLNADNSWKHSFKDLLKYDSTDGHEIRYTVEEVSLDGYTTVISGDPESGYIVTNTIIGKISMPVTKVWKGETGDKAVIHLFANEKEVDSVTLNKGNNWTYTFADLDEYDDEGVKIKYSIKEDPVKGYETSITGKADTGFVVTNTETQVPPTGVNTHNSAYWSLMIAAVGSLLLLTKKKFQNQ